MTEGIRIDKWLWAVRIFKTRNLATENCRMSRVLVGGEPAKPSRTVRLGDIITVKKPPLTLTYRVDGLIEKRVSAPEASHNVTNLTPPEELERVKKIHENAFFLRDRGAGRPTKKERRDLDKLTS
ncbi:MAG: RNA-binding S4 domain-containing protein [Bacteroidales bacterium]|nr:RNA-binding S4 domain-containing protein [Bacteroidales bacterium]MDD2570889.1 RNA-binding S4 domain-containing protein [Bacteroidales bacterium]MDD3811054.1 RNA-binding S4 domain-containing protein [Bacteroidales bacterium]MDD3870594.1 RNA-binding S4 domain-containing protein [Bacteroidales bacterium]MDD4812584.1 RNA-binding S4 domain-containing protein [Bacteroidales bacterium]